MLGYFAVWGSSLHIDKDSTNSWVVPTTLHIMFAGVILILSFFNYESPRHLIRLVALSGSVSQCHGAQVPHENGWECLIGPASHRGQTDW